MQEQARSLPYLNRLKANGSIVIALVFVTYVLLMLYLFLLYKSKAEIEKARILQDNYEKIVQVSINKISSLLQHLSSNLQNPSISMSSNIRDLEICGAKCVSYSLFRFGALVDRYIPEYIHYKIELNKNFLYTNFKGQSYQIEKIHHINDRNQFNISLSVDNIFWGKVETEIQKPFRILALVLGSNILLLYGLYKIFIKSLNKAYMSDYQANYKEELELLKSEHQKELKNCKSSLMNKIWNLNFNKQKDLEINCLFAQEANKIALVDENSNEQETMIKDCRLKNSSNKVPCSIILYNNNQVEEIKVEELINLFTDRFDQENDNVTVKIKSRTKLTYFSSKAALYQVIYSIISYLIFMLDKQHSTTQYNIQLVIDNTGRSMKLSFEYDGLNIEGEKGLLQMAHHFFKHHANPFLLNINQVFNILRINGFDCNLSRNGVNILEIMQKAQDDSQPIEQKDNVIVMSTFTEKKK